MMSKDVLGWKPLPVVALVLVNTLIGVLDLDFAIASAMRLCTFAVLIMGGSGTPRAVSRCSEPLCARNSHDSKFEGEVRCGSGK
mmetsp:Transcript_45343/g.110403  ORF Transcript_45343/g.110403 Transcript_45343/m.110403 type:complete len:84 (+) Transcript_45343:247-498(+)